MLTAAEVYLIKRGVPYRRFVHQQPPADLEQAAAERGQRLEQVVRTLLFRTTEGEFVMILIPGGFHVHWPALRQYLRQRRLTLATEEEVLRVTGYMPGSVSPFGLPAPLRILVDPHVFAVEEVSLGAGQPGVAIIMQREDLAAAVGRFELVNLVDEKQAHKTAKQSDNIG